MDMSNLHNNIKIEDIILKIKVLVFYSGVFIPDRKKHGHTDKIIGILGEVPLPLPLGCVEDIIISFVGGKAGMSVCL